MENKYFTEALVYKCDSGNDKTAIAGFTVDSILK